MNFAFTYRNEQTRAKFNMEHSDCGHRRPRGEKKKCKKARLGPLNIGGEAWCNVRTRFRQAVASQREEHAGETQVASLINSPAAKLGKVQTKWGFLYTLRTVDE